MLAEQRAEEAVTAEAAAIEAQIEAENQARLAQSQALVVEANQWLAQNEVVKGLVRAYQAAKVTYRIDGSITDEASVALFDVWNNQAQIANTQFRHDSAVISVDFHPQKDLILTLSDDDMAYLYDFFGNELARLSHGYRLFVPPVFHPEDDLILTTIYPEHTSILWDFDGNELAQFPHNSEITTAIFHMEEDLILTSSLDRTAILWGFDGKEQAQFPHDD